MAIVTLLIVVTELVMRLVPVDAYRGVIESGLGRALGLDVELAGDLHLSLLSRLHVEAQDVRVANLPGRPSPFLARVGEFGISLNLWALVRNREVEIRSIQASDVALHIEPDAEGRFQLPPGLTRVDHAGLDSSRITLSIERLGFEDMNVFLRASEGDRISHLHVEFLELEGDDFDVPVALELRGDLDGSRFDLSGEIGSAREFFAPTRPFPVSIRGDLFESRIEVEGSIEGPLELRGFDLRVKGSIPDFGRELRARGQKVPQLGAVSLCARFTNA